MSNVRANLEMVAIYFRKKGQLPVVDCRLSSIKDSFRQLFETDETKTMKKKRKQKKGK